MKKYHIEICIEQEQFLLFLNGVLMRPGYDFIIEDRTFISGCSLVIRKELQQGDLICIYVFETSYWLEFNGEKLIDKSADKTEFSEQYTKWMN